MSGEKNLSPMFKMITDCIERRANKELQPFDVTLSQIRILFALKTVGEDAMSLKELERVFQNAQQTIAGTVQRLEAKGLVHSLHQEQDKRIKFIQLSEKGNDLCESVEKKIVEIDQTILSGLTPDERKTLLILLRKVHAQVLKETAA